MKHKTIQKNTTPGPWKKVAHLGTWDAAPNKPSGIQTAPRCPIAVARANLQLHRFGPRICPDIIDPSRGNIWKAACKIQIVTCSPGCGMLELLYTWSGASKSRFLKTNFGIEYTFACIYTYLHVVSHSCLSRAFPFPPCYAMKSGSCCYQQVKVEIMAGQ